MYSTIAPAIVHSPMPVVHAAASISRSLQRQVIGEERRPRPLGRRPVEGPRGGPASGAYGESVLIRVSGTCAAAA